MDRRSFVVGTAASAATLAAGQAPAPDACPTRTVTMIRPFPPGGVSDTITRPLDAALEAVFERPVVLANKTARRAPLARSTSQLPNRMAVRC